jgi:hypothetical protein
MKLLDSYVTFILIIKVIFIILALSNLYLIIKIKREPNKTIQKQELEKQSNILFWKDRIEILFKCLMSILLLYLFNPREERLHLITFETKILLFLFGFIIIFTANWTQIYNESAAALYAKEMLKN